MIKTSLLTFFALALAQSQTKTTHDLSNGVAVLDSGVTLAYRTAIMLPVNNSAFRVLPKDLAFLPMGAAFGASGNTMRRLIYDKAAQSYFGYDMVVAYTPGAKSFQVSFGPLTVSGMTDALKAIAGDLPLNPAPPPKYPPPQTVYSGDTIALDIMISRDGREKIVDYIQLTAPAKSGTPQAAATAEPRDFSIDDGPLTFSIDAPAVRINGEKPSYTVAMTSHSGATLGFYFPGQGRYILSLAPHNGFVKSGILHGNMIAFQSNGLQYEIQLGAPIAGPDKVWNLYVLHDAAYLPVGKLADSVVGSVDRLENLLPKQL
jgi:hypothetical protein